MTGWLRSDLLTVAETEEPEETAEEPEETAETETPAAGYTIQEPSEAPAANYLTQTTVQSGDTSYTAWQADADTALYLVWAAAPDGSTGWYWYDPAQNTFQQDLGQFSSQGLVSALQNELTSLKESSADDLSLRLYIIIGLGVLSVILLVLVIVFAVKSRNVEYESYDDEDVYKRQPRITSGLSTAIRDGTPEVWVPFLPAPSIRPRSMHSARSISIRLR